MHFKQKTAGPCAFPGQVNIQRILHECSYFIEFIKRVWKLFRNGFNIFNNTRGIWKVLSMVLYLSNRFTNPIMCCIILKSYLSSMLWHKFNEYIISRHEKYYCEYMYCSYTGKRKISAENITYYLLKSVRNINNSS